MSHAFLPTTFLVLLLASACNPSAGSDASLLERTAAGSLYKSVGMIMVNGKQSCSGAILVHGVFATAKHCFETSRPAPASIALYFPQDGRVSEGAKLVAEGQVQDIFDDTKLDPEDTAGNDLSYIVYDPSLTRAIAIDAPTIQRAPPENGQKLHVVGYPASESGQLQRIISHDCQFNGVSNYAPKPGAPGYDGTYYDGLLWESTCEAWFGNSGGPIYAVDDAGKPTALVGVVTHTFKVDQSGKVLDVKRDEFGEHAFYVNVSPFAQAERLDEALKRPDGTQKPSATPSNPPF